MRLLVTGFGPFPGVRSNPSAKLAGLLAADLRLKRRGVRVETHLFPTTYAAADRDVPQLGASGHDAVLLLGVAARRKGLSVERFARNRLARFPDASGHRPGRRVIAPDGPLSRGARAPIVRLVVAGAGQGMRIAPSLNAGSYLCNYVYWRMLAATARTPVVFVHVPKLGGAAALARAENALMRLALCLLRSRVCAAAQAADRRD